MACTWLCKLGMQVPLSLGAGHARYHEQIAPADTNAGVHIPPWPEPSCEYTSDRGFLTSTAECQHQNWLCNSHCLALSGSTTGAGLELQSTNPRPFGGIMVSNSDEIKTDLWSLQVVGAACLFRPRFFHKYTPPRGSVTKGPRYYILWPVLHSRFLATTFYSAHSSLIGGSILLNIWWDT